MRFGEFDRRPFTKSAFFDVEADLSPFALPDQYVIIQHQSKLHSSPEQQKLRDLDSRDWEVIHDWLEAKNLVGVVVNSPDCDPAPEHGRIIDLTGKTSIPQSVALLARASGFAGIASWLCVLASQKFSAEDLLVKGAEPWLNLHKHIYFAPHTSYPFLKKHLTDEHGHRLPEGFVEIEMKLQRIAMGGMVTTGSRLEVPKHLADAYIRSGEASLVQFSRLPTK